MIRISLLIKLAVIAAIILFALPVVSRITSAKTSEGVVIVADCTPVIDAPDIPCQVYIDDGDVVTIVLR